MLREMELFHQQGINRKVCQKSSHTNRISAPQKKRTLMSSLNMAEGTRSLLTARAKTLQALNRRLKRSIPRTSRTLCQSLTKSQIRSLTQSKRRAWQREGQAQAAMWRSPKDWKGVESYLAKSQVDEERMLERRVTLSRRMSLKRKATSRMTLLKKKRLQKSVATPRPAGRRHRQALKRKALSRKNTLKITSTSTTPVRA